MRPFQDQGDGKNFCLLGQRPANATNPVKKTWAFLPACPLIAPGFSQSWHDISSTEPAGSAEIGHPPTVTLAA
jgi:hypothetical protein